jgi:hypothetical protein
MIWTYVLHAVHMMFFAKGIVDDNVQWALSFAKKWIGPKHSCQIAPEIT